MKKMLAWVMSLSVLLLIIPVSVSAVSSDTQVINKHGSYTYMGAYSDWEDDHWDSDNFTDVTGEDVDCSDTLIIKGGKLGDVEVSNDADLSIYGGTMDDVSCNGSISMSGGTANSLQSDEDIDISGGKVEGGVEAEDWLTLIGRLSVGGLMDAETIAVKPGSTVTASGRIDADTLNVENDTQLVAASTLNIGTITGPGTLTFNAGDLTVVSHVSDNPVFNISGTPKVGMTIFKAKPDAVSVHDAIVFGYSLAKTSSGGYDYFTLTSPTGSGVTLDTSSISMNSGGYATVKATVTPSPSELAVGTQLRWKLIDSSARFSIAPDTSNNTCKIYLSGSAGTSASTATLAVYLVDSSGDILSAYKSGICSVISSGIIGSVPSTGVVNTGITLDTASVNIKRGNSYFVLAVTDAKTPPVQMSYNSAIAVVGKAAAYSKNGKTGWLYPVKAVSTGSVTINIGGQKMIASVTSGG
nr:hypothetical protein [uncultured Caproiciproducens sp.]